MATSYLSEDQFLCSICLEVFTDPVTIPCGHNFCKTCITENWNISLCCQCPLCVKVFHSRPELCVNTILSEMVDMFKQSTVKKNGRAEEQQAESGEVSCEVCSETKMKAVNQAQGFIKELEKEVSELRMNISELEQLSHTGDHLQFLQSLPSLNPVPPTKDWTEVTVHSSYEGTVKKAVAQLEQTLSKEMKKLHDDVELKRVQQYAVDVTLDPDTAHPNLVLSDDGKQVSSCNKRQNFPETPKRCIYYANVLGKQGFSSGRFYYEVQVNEKTQWDLGVANESINRKEKKPLCPKNGYWTIRLRNGNQYKAVVGPSICLSLQAEPQKVGVFVDYEEGLVSFYDVGAAALIYSFTGCNFTEKLYPLFSPCFDEGGANSAPLIISSVLPKH
uniref:E3 ubiquitin-protein ligase TRIM39-like n=1 Tax=Pundamilia nyererei TaxID=303518 RepID=A0A3B4H153_9CICH